MIKRLTSKLAMTWFWLPFQTWVVIRFFQTERLVKPLRTKDIILKEEEEDDLSFWTCVQPHILYVAMKICSNRKKFTSININVRLYKSALPKMSTASTLSTRYTNILDLIYEHFWDTLTHTGSIYLHFWLFMFLHNLIKMEYDSTNRIFFD